MGGIGFIETHKAEIVRDNTLINMHTIEAARAEWRQALPVSRPARASIPAIGRRSRRHAAREEDAYPADAEDGYGWEKLYMERVCRHYREDFGLETRSCVSTTSSGRSAPTTAGARSRRPRSAARSRWPDDGDEIEVWGDGKQTRSYCYIDDCVEGIYRLMRSDYREPLNLGQDRLISINELVDIVAGIAGKQHRQALRPHQAAGRAWPQQRQHAPAAGARLGAAHHARGRTAADVPVDCGATRARTGSVLRTGLPRVGAGVRPHP